MPMYGNIKHMQQHSMLGSVNQVVNLSAMQDSAAKSISSNTRTTV